MATAKIVGGPNLRDSLENSLIRGEEIFFEIVPHGDLSTEKIEIKGKISIVSTQKLHNQALLSGETFEYIFFGVLSKTTLYNKELSSFLKLTPETGGVMFVARYDCRLRTGEMFLKPMIEEYDLFLVLQHGTIKNLFRKS